MSEIVESRWKRVDLHSGSYMHELHSVESVFVKRATAPTSVCTMKRCALPPTLLCEQRRHFTQVTKPHKRARSTT